MQSSNFLSLLNTLYGFHKESECIIFPGVIETVSDIQKSLLELHKKMTHSNRLLIAQYNFLWNVKSWISLEDMRNFADISGFETIKTGTHILLPYYIPLISSFVNKYLARLPLLRHLCVFQYAVLRKKPVVSKKKHSVSIIIPVRNERGTIQKMVQQLPVLGSKTEFIFVEGGSTDGSYEEIKRIKNQNQNKNKKIRLYRQNGSGKGDAVRLGFAKAKHDILMIYDADMSVAPTELHKFYDALSQNTGELVMGSRLLYPMEHQAMRFLNVLANKLFGLLFSYLLDQPIKDTLCGTKALFKKNYIRIAKNRDYFGALDPFGDFDLILGASKLDLKIVEIPVRYKARIYGETNISRFKHGLLLIRMVFLAMKKIKFY